jgi:tetratricopeptide (TPR) repeat protein
MPKVFHELRVARVAWAVALLGGAWSLQIGSTGLELAAAHAQAVRAEVGKPLQQARDLIQARKHRDALAKLREVEAVPNRTAHENFLLEQMRASAALGAGDHDQAIRAMQALIASGKLSAADEGRYAANIASLYYRANNHKSAAEWAQRALRSNPGDATMRGILIQSHFLAGDLAAASREALADVQAAEKAGRAPPEDRLQLLANIASRGNDRAAYVAALERLVAYYPKREYWNDLLRRLEAKPGFSNRLTMDLYRLRLATKTVTSASDYLEMAQLALQQRQVGEAKQIVEEGFKAGLLGKGPEAERHQRLQALVDQRLAEAPTALQTAEADARTAKDGSALVNVGFAYANLGQTEKGIDLMQQGIKLLQQSPAKGRQPRLDDANLHLGVALHRAGQKSRANQAFRAVTGTDGASDLARLWTRVG